MVRKDSRVHSRSILERISDDAKTTGLTRVDFLLDLCRGHKCIMIISLDSLGQSLMLMVFRDDKVTI